MSNNRERLKTEEYPSSGPVFHGTAVFLTAIPVERDSVLKRLKNIRSETQLGHHFQIGDFSGSGFNWKVVLPPSTKGNVRASAMTALTIPIFNPDIMMFVGTAGGLDRVKRGDVVVADLVYQYGPRKEAKEGTGIRPWSKESSDYLYEIAKAQSVNYKWKERARVSPIVSGEVILADLVRDKPKELYDELRAHFEDAVAIETEGMGLLVASGLYGGTERLVVRGISDLLYDESAHGSAWKKASDNATDFALDVLSEVKRNSDLLYLKDERTLLPTESRAILAENSMYELGMQIAKKSKHLLVIAQRTPSLLLGAEPLDEKVRRKKHTWDLDFIEVLDRCVQRAKRRKDFKFVYLYSLSRTKQRLKELGPDSRERVRKAGLRKLKNYLGAQGASDYRFRISHIDDRASLPNGKSVKFSGPLAIGDEDVAIWLAESGKGSQRMMLSPFLKSVKLSHEISVALVNLVAPSPASLEDLQVAFLDH